MTLTLRDVFDLEVMAQVRILAGAGGMGRVVTSATVLDAPDAAAWLRGGELAFTSTYPLVDLGDGFGAFVQKLARQGVCGLGVKLTRYMKAIPADAIEVANRLDFPILLLPEQMAWVELINPIITEVLSREANRRGGPGRVSEDLAERLAESARLEDVANVLADAVGNPVVIRCPAEGIVARSRQLPGSDDLADVIDVLGADGRAEDADAGHGGVRRRRGAASIVEMPLAAKAGIAGSIAVVERNRRLGDDDLDRLGRARRAISIQVVRLVADVRARRARMSTFVTAVADARITDMARERALREGAADGLVLVPPFVVAACRLRGIGSRNLTGIAARIHGHSAGAAGVLVGFSGPGIMVAIFCDPREDGPERWLRGLFDGLQREFPALRLRGGISRRLQEARELSEGHAQAERIVSLGPEEATDAFCVRRLEDVGFLRLFASAAVRDEARRFVGDWLDPLIVQDNRTGGSLVETLQVFLEAGGNHRRAAQRLHLHHNTVRYRITRIRKLTGHDVVAPERRLQYELALALLTVVGHAAPPDRPGGARSDRCGTGRFEGG